MHGARTARPGLPAFAMRSLPHPGPPGVYRKCSSTPGRISSSTRPPSRTSSAAGALPSRGGHRLIPPPCTSSWSGGGLRARIFRGHLHGQNRRLADVASSSSVHLARFSTPHGQSDRWHIPKRPVRQRTRQPGISALPLFHEQIDNRRAGDRHHPDATGYFMTVPGRPARAPGGRDGGRAGC